MIAAIATAVLLLAAGGGASPAPPAGRGEAEEGADEARLDRAALAARARRLGLDREPRFRHARALAELKVLAQLAAERHRDRLEGAPITEPELRQAYAGRAAALAGEPRFTARQLVVYVVGNPAFIELHVLAAKARKDGLDRTPASAARLARLEEAILGEFAEAAEGLAPAGLCSGAGSAGQEARRAHLDRLRLEAGLPPARSPLRGSSSAGAPGRRGRGGGLPRTPHGQRTVIAGWGTGKDMPSPR